MADRRLVFRFACRALIFGALATGALALEPVVLPSPQMVGGKPLMEALKLRASRREFRVEKLPLQTLSNLLWAAWGVNRPNSGHRTAPSARNRQEIDVYAVLAEGAYFYDAKAHRLQPVAEGDLRALTGRQPFVGQAPLNLVYVLDRSRTSGDEQEVLIFGGVAAGAIAQNVYLFCASEGLATVVRGLVDGAVLAKALRLRPEQQVLLAQTVGFPSTAR